MKNGTYAVWDGRYLTVILEPTSEQKARANAIELAERYGKGSYFVLRCVSVVKCDEDFNIDVEKLCE